MARTAYAIEEAQFQALVAEGFEVDTRGGDLVPSRKLVWITTERAERLSEARELALHLDVTMLASPVLALVPFHEGKR